MAAYGKLDKQHLFLVDSAMDARLRADFKAAGCHTKSDFIREAIAEKFERFDKNRQAIAA